MRKTILVLLAMALLATPALAQDTLRIHYHRFDDAYAGWGIHLWNAIEWEDGGVFYIDGTRHDWNSPLLPTGTDAYGVYWDIDIVYPDQELGFIIHNGATKDPGPDQFWDDYTTENEIWVLSGFAQIFTAEPNPDVRLMSAVSDGANAIALNLAVTATLVDSFHVYKDGVEETVTARVVTTPQLVTLTLQDPVDITAPYTVYDGVGENTLAVHHDFDDTEYVYEGEDMGATYSAAETTFKLWSPVAETARVRIYDNAWGDDDSDAYDEYILTRPDATGVMAVTVPGDHEGRWYLFEMTIYGETWLTPDLYAVAMSSNSRRSAIVDLDSTDPPGWAGDAYPDFPTLESVIWEAHVRDVTTSEFWDGSAAGKHKFTGVVETGTSHQGRPTGLDHVLDLGVNVVQILPMYDFSSVDENNPDSRNWGYDPYIYNTPEGGYSSDPDDPGARITEMKQMIQGFHDQGVKVVMDVVYNHTHNVGPQGSTYDAMVPKYYYRLETDGSYSNGSGVGNEVATEKEMARRFILQSCLYWVQEYHIDGFRFDLMGLIDTPLMTEITAAVKAINPHAIIYGEPWGGYGGTILTGKGDQRGLGFGVFNDNIRNAIRGSTDGTDAGYAMGDVADRAAVIRGLAGAIDDFTDGPTETINYISAHDNYTWWDKLDYRWNPNETPPPHYPEATLQQMSRLGLSMVLTAQGVPFLHAGSEFLRTKRTGEPGQDEESIRNSYASNDAVNKLDWQLRADNDDMVEYIKGLIALRHLRHEFKLGTADSIRAHQHFLTGLPTTAIAYTLDDVTPGDGAGDWLVIHNVDFSAVDVPLPAGQWAQVVGGTAAGTTPFATHISAASAPSSLSVPARSTVVLYQESAPTLQLNIFQNPTLDAYLHLAVNDRSESVAMVVTINGTVVPVTNQATGSWFGSYLMDASGELRISISNTDASIVRRVAACALGDGAAASLDGRAVLVPPAGRTAGWLLAVDKAGRPELGDDAWSFGTAAATLPGAVLRVQGVGVIERRSAGSWTALPTRDLGDGWLEAPVDALGEFRLNKSKLPAAATRLLGNVPNPFNPSTEIRFELGTADAGRSLDLAIFDLRGRLVRTLRTGALAAGYQTVTWDGRDTAGNATAAGVYFYRLTTQAGDLTGRMLMIK
ncbi:MAG: type I pullulanase [bacterium]|nr:type I pullulanase [bacterium]